MYRLEILPAHYSIGEGAELIPGKETCVAGVH